MLLGSKARDARQAMVEQVIQDDHKSLPSQLPNSTMLITTSLYSESSGSDIECKRLAREGVNINGIPGFGMVYILNRKPHSYILNSICQCCNGAVNDGAISPTATQTNRTSTGWDSDPNGHRTLCSGFRA